MLELVIIVTVILALGTAVTIWIDPVQKIGWTKDNHRYQDVMSLSSAFADYAEKHRGALPIFGSVSTTEKVLCNTQSGSLVNCNGSSEYCLKIDDPTFFTKNITSLPIAPEKSTDADTGYYIKKDSNGFLIIGACNYDQAVVNHRLLTRATCDAYGGGYCWYSSANSDNCNTKCAANGLVCASLSHASDSLCLLSDALNSTYSCSTCNAGAGTEPPSWGSSNTCTYQVGTLDCSVGASGGYSVCPCH